MKIVGLQKLTLLDFPRHVSCTVFIGKCNFKCPFCYNSSLISEDYDDYISEEFLFSFLEKRKGILDGVAITGGEPLLHKEVKDLIIKIKRLGFLVKLDTNGSNPNLLQELIDENLVDYVAMDMKNSYAKYHLTTGVKIDVKTIQKSVEILLKNKVDYEFRTTVSKPLHNLEDFKQIGEQIKGAKRYFIQNYQYQDSVLDKSLQPLSKEELDQVIEIVKVNVESVSLRGIE